MIAQLILSTLLAAILLYAWTESRPPPPARPAGECIHVDIFQRMQYGEGADDAAHIASRNGRREHGSPAQERQQRPQAEPSEYRQHGNYEQNVAHAVVDGRALNDQKSKRQDNRRADDKTSAAARYL